MRQYHKVPTEKINGMVNTASNVLCSTEETDAKESSSSDSDDESPKQINTLYNAEILRRGAIVDEDSDSDDPDWLYSNYFNSNVIGEVDCESRGIDFNVSCVNGGLYDNDPFPNPENCSDSDIQELDFEDSEERFFMT